MIVATKLQSLADLYETSADKIKGTTRIAVTTKSLAYGYNLDVYYNPKHAEQPGLSLFRDPEGERVGALERLRKSLSTNDERVLSKSKHVQHIEEQKQR